MTVSDCRRFRPQALGMFRGALAAALVVAAVALAGGAKAQSLNASPEPARFTDQSGRTVTIKDYLGKPSLVFFGFTSCPNICPTALSEVAGRMADLGPLADRINFIFVSVDPERDTPQVLRDYVGSFDGRIIGLTGTLADISALARETGAHFQKVPQEGGGYTIDHSTAGFLMDPGWRRVGLLLLGPGTNESRANARLRGLLDEAGH